MESYMFFLFGFAMVVTLIGIILFYYQRKRHDKGEEPKYTMMDDDD